jgi:hypothetical protein
VEETDHFHERVAKPVLSQALLGPLTQLGQAAVEDDNAGIYERLVELVPSYHQARGVEGAPVAVRVASLD